MSIVGYAFLLQGEDALLTTNPGSIHIMYRMQRSIPDISSVFKTTRSAKGQKTYADGGHIVIFFMVSSQIAAVSLLSLLLEYD